MTFLAPGEPREPRRRHTTQTWNLEKVPPYWIGADSTKYAPGLYLLRNQKPRRYVAPRPI